MLIHFGDFWKSVFASLSPLGTPIRLHYLFWSHDRSFGALLIIYYRGKTLGLACVHMIYIYDHLYPFLPSKRFQSTLLFIFSRLVESSLSTRALEIGCVGVRDGSL